MENFFIYPASLLAERLARLPLLKIAILGNIFYSLYAFFYLPENNILLVGLLLLPLIVFISP
jgi:hypothetical protein